MVIWNSILKNDIKINEYVFVGILNACYGKMGCDVSEKLLSSSVDH